MNAQQKYEAIINTIETTLENHPYITTRDLADSIAKSIGMNYRDTNTVFTFLTNSSLQDYIRERKFMTAYRELLEQRDQRMDNAAELAGYDNPSSFGKEFRKRFHMTPTQAHERKDVTMLTAPLTWQGISTQKTTQATNVVKPLSIPATRFGLDPEHFDRIMQARDLQALYEFNETQSEVAFEIADQYRLPLKEAFEFVDDYCIYHYMTDDGFALPSYTNLHREITCNADLLTICTQYGLSISEAIPVLYDFNSRNLIFQEIDPQIIDAYFEGKWTLDELLSLHKHFIQAEGTDFEDFLSWLTLRYQFEDNAFFSYSDTPAEDDL